MSYGGPQSTRNHFREPPSLISQATSRVRTIVQTWGIRPQAKRFTRLLSVAPLLTILWLYTVYWGERTVFNSSINQCQWEQWEQWVCEAISQRSTEISDQRSYSPRARIPIISFSLQTRSSLTLTRILDDLGHSRASPSATQTFTCEGAFRLSKNHYIQTRSFSSETCSMVDGSGQLEARRAKTRNYADTAPASGLKSTVGSEVYLSIIGVTVE
jgi:hypothetical protein